ncbi:DUF4402 domain-containing protein [Phenylobacterium deserti]|uniref:DUF4402 domain-containing protein n=1 Tax=Phenylobacterium deserti TaxID=1914756 RepID=A0A328ATJ1_9CAUL|nr:DUF4402 domain-containing protein [Phenylobacterium deserti]RAK56814.1 hypothetical protein DJ018_02235 [Phenylobacterium deserti]
MQIQSLAKRILPLAVVAAAVFASPALAQTSANQSTTGTIGIYQPIQLTRQTNLSFGTVMRPSSGTGNVVIDAQTGALTATGGITQVSNGNAASRATFTVTGDAGMNFNVQYPQTFNMTRQNGSETIPVTLNASVGSAQLVGTTGGVGTANFGIGGQVSISNTTLSGSYSGTFTVTVAYQ